MNIECPLYMAFMDFKKAFNSVENWAVCWKNQTAEILIFDVSIYWKYVILL